MQQAVPTDQNTAGQNIVFTYGITTLFNSNGDEISLMVILIHNLMIFYI